MGVVMTTPRKLSEVGDAARLQREADREHVEKSAARMKANIPSIELRQSQQIALRIVQLIDLYMDLGRVQDAAILVYGVQASAFGRGEDALEVLRELAI
jgi:hypothetical protein